MHHRLQRLLATTGAVLAVSSSLGAPMAASSDPCRGLETMTMPDGSVLCTHGDDDHLRAHVAADGAAPAPLRRAAAQCYSDGVDGYRVSVLYVHAHGSPNRLASVEADIRRDVQQVEAMIVDSAAAQGGERYVRWETEASGAGCRPRVEAVAIPRPDLDDVMSTVTALAKRGYGRTDRRYALYVDDDRYCGIATMPRDRQAGPSNVANRRAGYARVDRDCWNRGDRGAYATMAHELVHSLGAVQPEAPHSTPGGHCTDEWDPLCYDDGTGGASRVRCRAQGGSHDDHHRQLDCGADDYFSVAPAAGSYLANNWNTADSPYLATAPGYGTGGAGTIRASDVRWPADRGTYRPSSAVGGFEACDLPLAVAPAGTRSGSMLGSSTRDDAAITSVTRSTVDRVNALAGMTLLELADPRAEAEPAAGTLLVGRTSASTSEVTVWTAGDQTSRARVLLPGSRPTVDVALPAVLDALGVGSVPFGDKVTGRSGGARARGTSTALRHLYGSGCNTQPRLHVNAPGHPSQLTARADRRRVDVGRARSAVDLGVEVSTWLRGEAGADQAARAVVCRDDVPADCLAGAGLLAGGGPLAFVPGGRDGHLPRAVADELDRAVARGGTVTVLGGPAAVAPRVVDQLRAALPGRKIARVFGGTRYDTAAAVARRVAPRGADRVLVARGDDPADAVVAAALAARDGLPVVLTTPGGLSAPAAAYLRDTRSPLGILLGGPHALTAQVEREVAGITRAVRVAGNTRTGTAVSIARSGHLWGRTAAGRSAAVVAVPGYGPHAWQAALAAAPVAAHLDAPVTYLAPDRVPHSDGGTYDTAEYVAGMPVKGASRVAATSVVVGARLGGLDAKVPATFHALFLPALRDRVELVAD